MTSSERRVAQQSRRLPSTAGKFPRLRAACAVGDHASYGRRNILRNASRQRRGHISRNTTDIFAGTQRDRGISRSGVRSHHLQPRRTRTRPRLADCAVAAAKRRVFDSLPTRIHFRNSERPPKRMRSRRVRGRRVCSSSFGTGQLSLILKANGSRCCCERLAAARCIFGASCQQGVPASIQWQVRLVTNGMLGPVTRTSWFSPRASRVQLALFDAHDGWSNGGRGDEFQNHTNVQLPRCRHFRSARQADEELVGEKSSGQGRHGIRTHAGASPERQPLSSMFDHSVRGRSVSS